MREGKLSRLWLLAAAAAGEMCVNTTQRHKLLRGGGRRASLYLCSARCCHLRGPIVTNRSAHKMLLSALPSPPPPKQKKKIPALVCSSELVFFFFCCYKILGWSNSVFTGFERCCSRRNSTAASNPAVYGILSWPLLNVLHQVGNILLQEHSSLFLS